MSVPVVLDLIICSAGQLSSNHRPLVTQKGVKLDDEFVFLLSEVTSFEIRPKIVDPSKTAALATSEQTCSLRKGTPTSFSMGFDVGDEALIFFLSPSSFVCMRLFTAGRPAHGV